VRDQLVPLEKLGQSRADTATRTLAAYLHEQGSIIKTARRLYLSRLVPFSSRMGGAPGGNSSLIVEG
jgi:hypothetical protein